MLDYAISYRTLATILTGVLAASLIGAGWALDEVYMALAGLAVANTCAVLAVQADNSKTRRAVRVAVRAMTEERAEGRGEVRSLR